MLGTGSVRHLHAELREGRGTLSLLPSKNFDGDGNKKVDAKVTMPIVNERFSHNDSCFVTVITMKAEIYININGSPNV